MAEVNYKTKYLELKQKFMSAIDTAFRLGVEQGMQQAQVQQAQQQAADAQAQQDAMNGQPGDDGSGGQPGEEQPGQEQGNPASEHPEGSELDQHISQLETAMGKSEYGTEQYEALAKSLNGLKSLKVGYEHAAMLRKNEVAIKTIAKNMKPKLTPVRTMNDRARKNLSEQQKATLGLQQQIVDDVFKHWDAEESDMIGKVLELVGSEGKLKKD